MTRKKQSPTAQVSPEEVHAELRGAVQKFFLRAGLDLQSRDFQESYDVMQSLPPGEQLPKAVQLALRFGMGLATKREAQQIKTREDLNHVLATISKASERAPTILRKGLKEFQRDLPRRGGPGRKKILTPQETAFLFDRIAEKFRKGTPIKEAIRETAEEASELVGKKVGARTLENSWAKRNEFPNR
jgi:hypothetical protein